MNPTFPIDQQELNKRSRDTVFGSVLTWAAWIPTIGVWSVMDIASWLLLPMAAVTGVGLFTYWRSQLKKLRPEWMLQQIKKSNRQQDKMLHQQIKAFEKKSADWEANALRTVKEQKAAIEKKLLEAQPDIALWGRIESLVDTLAFSLVDKLNSYQQNPAGGAKAEIEEAINQIYQTNADLHLMISPSSQMNDLPSSDRLTHSLNALREEREIAHRVRERLESGYSETEVSSPPSVSE